MMSLYDYQGHADKDGTGLKVNAYAILTNQPYKKRLLEFNNMEVFLYRKEFLDEYFKVQKIFNTELIVE
tara:strand:- start:29 stop:235 length:207 start_codon:yes stop_codon:yes gene_type:complete